LGALALSRRSLADEMANYRQQKLQHPYHSDDELRASIRKTLRKTYLLLGCAVRLKIGTAGETNPALRPFGFILDGGAIRSEHKDLMIVGLGVMGAAVFALVYSASSVGGLAARVVGWSLSEQFPSQGEAFAWLISALLTHGTAILVAERMRSRRLAANRWFMNTGAVRRGTPANYILVALACAVISFVPLFLFSLVFVDASWELAKQLVPFSLLPASTGTFFVWHLDNADLGRRPGRLREIAAQMIATSLCATVAANMTTLGIDLLFLNAAVGAAIGASLAWYIPKAAANAKGDAVPQFGDANILIVQTEPMQNVQTSKLAPECKQAPLAELGLAA